MDHYLKNLPNYISELFDKIARENEFENFTVQMNLGSKPGDGFGGEILSITISENDCAKKLDLVCKIAPLNKIRRKEMCSGLNFRNEALWYDHIEPLFAQFQAERNLPLSDQFRSSPKCYATLIDDENERYVIVLEDLRPLKFEMWNKAKLAPIENLRMTMCELGKLHALSFAIKDQCPTEFANLKKIKNVRLEMTLSDTMKQLMRNTVNLTVASLEREEHKSIARYLIDNSEHYWKQFFDVGANNDFGVLCHGTTIFY